MASQPSHPSTKHTTKQQVPTSVTKEHRYLGESTASFAICVSSKVDTGMLHKHADMLVEHARVMEHKYGRDKGQSAKH